MKKNNRKLEISTADIWPGISEINEIKKRVVFDTVIFFSRLYFGRIFLSRSFAAVNLFLFSSIKGEKERDRERKS